MSLRYLEKVLHNYEGKPVTTFQWRGEDPFWIAAEIGQVLGYGADGYDLIRLIEGQWSHWFEEGLDFDILTKGPFFEFVMALANQYDLDRTAKYKHPPLFILYESGIEAIRFKADDAKVDCFRRRLRAEVLPKFRRSNYYVRPLTTEEVIDANQAEMIAEAAKMVKAGSKRSLHLYAKLTGGPVPISGDGPKWANQAPIRESLQTTIQHHVQGKTIVTTDTLLTLLNLSMDGESKRRVREAMRHLGWTQGRAYIEDRGQVRCWLPPQHI